jgi:hypothetical protein
MEPMCLLTSPQTSASVAVKILLRTQISGKRGGTCRSDGRHNMTTSAQRHSRYMMHCPKARCRVVVRAARATAAEGGQTADFRIHFGIGDVVAALLEPGSIFSFARNRWRNSFGVNSRTRRLPISVSRSPSARRRSFRKTFAQFAQASQIP